MKIKTDQRIKALEIKVAGTVAGLLAKNTQFGFNYHPDSLHSVSITMPIDELHYQHGALFPVFEMNLPEGFVRYRITEQLRKYVPVDEMLFLALQGSKGIGRISYHNSNIELDEYTGESLSEILGWQGKQDLFNTLLGVRRTYHL